MTLHEDYVADIKLQLDDVINDAAFIYRAYVVSEMKMLDECFPATSFVLMHGMGNTTMDLEPALPGYRRIHSYDLDDIEQIGPAQADMASRIKKIFDLCNEVEDIFHINLGVIPDE